MKRTARDKRDLPHPPPVERIELNEDNSKRRLLFALLMLVIGGAALAYGFWQLVTPQSGWQVIEVSSTAGPTFADDFVFLYRLGDTEVSPTAERKAVSEIYTQLCRDAYEQFHNEESFEGVSNLYAVNRHPNEELTVGKALYDALSAVEASGSRYIYLGPVYDRYEGVFYCTDDFQLADFDPYTNAEIAKEYAAYASYARDPAQVQVELLGGNRVCLRVSEEYLSYAQREGIDTFIEFSWMRNAFIADYIASGLTAQGYTSGVLSTYDGFVRNLDTADLDYSLQLYALYNGTVYPSGLMQYRGPLSAVNLRDYPVSEADEVRFYRLRTGELRTPYVDLTDGLTRTAAHELTCYAQDKTCGELLLSALPVYIADDLDVEALSALASQGIATLRCEDAVLYPSDADIVVTELFADDTVRFTVSQAGK